VRGHRGDPAETRAKLVAAAAREIEQRGYHGTDTNRIARAAGYAPGTFYKHFADKRAILLAAHAAWVAAEWDAIDQLAGPAAIIDFVVEHHRRWRGLRASVRVLVQTDPGVRRFHRAERRRQLERLGAGARASAARRTAGALLLLEIERVADAIADGELAALGVASAEARRHLVARVTAYVASRRPPARRRRAGTR
jgi:AcrR family transcriptional regulator